jgi:hypothetical protein
MSLKNWLLNDNITSGLLLGLLIPVPAATIFAVILRLVQVNFLLLGEVRLVNMLLLGIAINVIVMRFYILKYKLVDTAKGILISTIAIVLVFFLLLKNTNITFPF